MVVVLRGHLVVFKTSEFFYQENVFAFELFTHSIPHRLENKRSFLLITLFLNA